MSNKQKQVEIAKELVALYGRTTLTAKEVIEYVREHHEMRSIPAVIWKTKCGRGEFDVSELVAESSYTPRQNPGEVLVEPKEEKVSVVGSSRETINSEAQIPRLSTKYVEWGNFSDVEKLVKSKQFFSLYIYGLSGTGKNVMVEQACAKNKRPLVRVQMTKETTEEHLVGSKTLVEGNVVYDEGPIVWAAKNGGVVVIDELSAADPNNIMCLQNILEGGSFFVKSLNEQITPAPGFAIIATDNTKGRGDDTGRFIGTNIQNDALLDRFEMMMEQKFPNQKTEIEIMKNEMLEATNGQRVDMEFIERLANWVIAIRESFLQEAIDEMISTRRSAAIIRTHSKFFDAKRSIELCINRFDDTTKEAFQTIWDKLEVVPKAEETDAEAEAA